MQLNLLFDHRFKRSPDGIIYSQAAYNYDLLADRYLSVFDSLQIVARVEESISDERQDRTAEGEGISIVSAGAWRGPTDFLRSRKNAKTSVESALNSRGAIICVAPGSLGQMATRMLNEHRPYGLEVVGDPFDVFAPGAVSHPARPLLRWWSTKQLRKQCERATSIAYVSESLASRYPAPCARFRTQYSSIELLSEHFATEVSEKYRSSKPISRDCNFVTVASLEVPYKGVDDLLRAFALVLSEHPDFSLTVVGDGALRPDLEQMAQDLGIGVRCTFTGRLPAGDAVRNVLDKADCFVLPSRTEGLPRAMIEAMARGLPCVGTRVGGIPELLRAEDMVPANNSEALAEKLMEVASNPQRMTEMSSRNLKVAEEYRSDVLQGRRIEMYTHLKEASLEWQRSTQS